MPKPKQINSVVLSGNEFRRLLFSLLADQNFIFNWNHLIDRLTSRDQLQTGQRIKICCESGLFKNFSDQIKIQRFNTFEVNSDIAFEFENRSSESFLKSAIRFFETIAHMHEYFQINNADFDTQMMKIAMDRADSIFNEWYESVSIGGQSESKTAPADIDISIDGFEIPSLEPILQTIEHRPPEIHLVVKGMMQIDQLIDLVRYAAKQPARKFTVTWENDDE